MGLVNASLFAPERQKDQVQLVLAEQTVMAESIGISCLCIDVSLSGDHAILGVIS